MPKTVLDQTTGAPLPGAQVTVVGVKLAAEAGTDGRFTIAGVPPGTYRVQTQRIGYGLSEVTVEVAAGQTASADFRLQQLAVALQEVVVVGYGTQVRRDVTGSVASVGGDVVHEVPKVNAIEAIKGRVPGVDIVTTGNKPGDGIRVRLRGERSLRASNDPLYVLDGIPMAGGIGDLNPRAGRGPPARRSSPTIRTAAFRSRSVASRCSTARSLPSIGVRRSAPGTTTGAPPASRCATPRIRSCSGPTGRCRPCRPAGRRTGRTWYCTRGRRSITRSASRAGTSRPASPSRPDSSSSRAS